MLTQYTRIQKAMARRVVLADRFDTIRLIGAFDTSYIDNMAITAAVVFESNRIVDKKVVIQKITFPYIPGYLAYREGPPILAAYRALDVKPDLIVVDGHGIAHPRRFGLACYVGLKLRKPTIGIAKRALIGKWRKGACSRLVHDGQQVGWVIDAKHFISPGHLISLRQSLRYGRKVVRLRLIEAAHQTAKEMSRCMKKCSLII